MIKPSELRIGNYFHPTHIANEVRLPQITRMLYVTALSMFGRIEHANPHNKETEIFEAATVAPVQLTSDLLGKCGFTRFPSGRISLDVESYNTIRFAFDPEHGTLETYLPADQSGFGRDIKFLHELQNRFFDLTGEELTINL